MLVILDDGNIIEFEEPKPITTIVEMDFNLGPAENGYRRLIPAPKHIMCRCSTTFKNEEKK